MAHGAAAANETNTTRYLFKIQQDHNNHHASEITRSQDHKITEPPQEASQFFVDAWKQHSLNSSNSSLAQRAMLPALTPLHSEPKTVRV